MRAARIHRYGGPEVIVIDDVPRPTPSHGEIVVRVAAAGVGPWDALIRVGNSAVSPPLPLTLGSDLAGVVETAGPGVAQFKPGDKVYGVTNQQFCGAYADYAAASAGMMARLPAGLSDVQGASVPVVAVTAWQMLFEYAQATAGQTIFIQGAAGNVGGYAVQLCRHAGIHVIASASSADDDYVKGLGADVVLDYRTMRPEEYAGSFDAVIDTVGGNARDRSFELLKPGGILVTAASPVPEEQAKRYRVRATFFMVDVSTDRLNRITDLLEQGKLRTDVGTVLPLSEAQTAHRMLAGAPHQRGKIVLHVSA